MDADVIYKLAFVQDPTVAVASAAAAVGLPRCFTKLAVSLPIVQRMMKPVRNLTRTAIKRPYGSPSMSTFSPVSSRGLRSATTPQALEAFRREAPQALPGLGRRMLKDWWTIPAAGAGVYGLSRIPAMFSGGEDQQMGAMPPMGYGYPAVAQTPAQGRYQQMMALARQHGYR